MTQDKILLIIPCYNEARSIEALLDEIMACNKPYEPLIIDDGSCDDTAGRVAGKAKCIRLVCNLGIGGAVQTGFKYAQRHGYQWCIQLDGDGQHIPSQIDKLVTCQQETGADIVVGSRFINRGNKNVRQTGTTFLRRLGGRLIGRIINLLYGQRIQDTTSGFRLMNARAVSLFCDNYSPDFPEPISSALAMHCGLTIAETQVQMRARQHGVSSINGLKSLSYMVRVVGSIILQAIFVERKRYDNIS